MPLVISGKRRLVEAYQSAGATGAEKADALVSRILANHQRHLAELQELHAGLLAPGAHD